MESVAKAELDSSYFIFSFFLLWLWNNTAKISYYVRLKCVCVVFSLVSLITNLSEVIFISPFQNLYNEQKESLF